MLKIWSRREIKTAAASFCKCYSVVAEVQHYDNTTSKIDITKTEEWNNALPFESIPGPKPLPIIGNSWRFFKYIGDWYDLDALEIQERCYEEYGPISTLGPLFGRKTVFICEPKNIEKLFRNEGTAPVRLDVPSFIRYRTVERKDIYKDNVGVVILQGKDWIDFRSKVNPIVMNVKSTTHYINKIDGVADTLIDKINYFLGSKIEGEMPADFAKDLAKYAFDNIGIIALDRHFKCLDKNTKPDSEYLRMIDTILEGFRLLHYLDVLPPIWKYVATPTWNRYINLLDDVSSKVMNIVEESVKSLKTAPEKLDHEKSVLEKLINVDVDVAKTMAIDMLLTAIDTTSKTLANILYLLAQNPEKQNILRGEMLKVLPKKDSPVTKDVLDNIPYLKAVIKEGNRLAPVAIGNQRLTVKDMVLCGYQIPKGTEIMTSNYILARMDKYFPEAKRFIPERWLRSTKGDLSYKNTNQFVSLPFGYGPRSCIGKRFANLELEIAIAKIIRNYELSWPHPDAKFRTIFLNSIVDPLQIHMKKINP